MSYNVPWSKEEEKTLKKFYPYYLRKEITKEDLLKIFPSRTYQSILRKASGLGITCSVEGKVDHKVINEIIKRIKI